jgi:hypothetical protein
MPAFGATRVRVTSGSHVEVAASGTARGWALASYVVSHASGLGVSRVSYAGRSWTTGNNRGWQTRSTTGTTGSEAAVVVD